MSLKQGSSGTRAATAAQSDLEAALRLAEEEEAKWRRPAPGPGRAGRGFGTAAEDPARFYCQLPFSVRPPSGYPQPRSRPAPALTGRRGGSRDKDAIMHSPAGATAAALADLFQGKGGRGSRGRTTGTRAGAAPPPTVPAPRGSRWRPGRASSGAEAPSWHPRHPPTCSLRVLLLRHLGAEPVAWETPIPNPAGRARAGPGRAEEAPGRTGVPPP